MIRIGKTTAFLIYQLPSYLPYSFEKAVYMEIPIGDVASAATSSPFWPTLVMWPPVKFNIVIFDELFLITDYLNIELKLYYI